MCMKYGWVCLPSWSRTSHWQSGEATFASNWNGLKVQLNFDRRFWNPRILSEKWWCTATPCHPLVKDGFSGWTGCPSVQFGPVVFQPAGAGHRHAGAALPLRLLSPAADPHCPPAQPPPSLPAWLLRLAAAHPGGERGGGKTRGKGIGGFGHQLLLWYCWEWRCWGCWHKGGPEESDQECCRE